MFKPWITVPAEDVRIQMPLSMTDGEIKIMFKDVQTIDNVIKQLDAVRSLVAEMEGVL